MVPAVVVMMVMIMMLVMMVVMIRVMVFNDNVLIVHVQITMVIVMNDDMMFLSGVSAHHNNGQYSESQDTLAVHFPLVRQRS